MTWEAIDLDAGTVEIRGTVIRIKGHGLIVKPRPKTKAGFRTLRLPSWAVAMLGRRAANVEPNRWGVVFTSPLGMLRDPSNTGRSAGRVRSPRLWVDHLTRVPQDGRHGHGQRQT